jgi:hypothetical protein
MPTPRKHTGHAARQRGYERREKASGLALLAAKNMPPVSPIPSMPSGERWRELLQAIVYEKEAHRDDLSAAGVRSLGRRTDL